MERKAAQNDPVPHDPVPDDPTPQDEQDDLPYSAMPALEAADKVLEGLRRKIKLAPISQRAIERHHGWNRGYLSQVLSGHIALSLHHVMAVLDSLSLDVPGFFAEALEREAWSSAREIRERMARYDAAFAELEAKGLLGGSDGGSAGAEAEPDSEPE